MFGAERRSEGWGCRHDGGLRPPGGGRGRLLSSSRGGSGGTPGSSTPRPPPHRIHQALMREGYWRPVSRTKRAIASSGIAMARSHPARRLQKPQSGFTQSLSVATYRSSARTRPATSSAVSALNPLTSRQGLRVATPRPAADPGDRDARAPAGRGRRSHRLLRQNALVGRAALIQPKPDGPQAGSGSGTGWLRSAERSAASVTSITWRACSGVTRTGRFRATASRKWMVSACMGPW